MNNRYLVIHAHMYQPPRENPWLEDVEIQDGAYPYHDWNERVTAESYAPNAYARILDEQQKIIRIANNYRKISFNFGPTLLGWLEAHSKALYSAVLEADRASIKERSGHGNAIAQCYNHIIMPLANGRDKRTQVIWGIEDFTRRFSRPPEGMWLPETAVDAETLEILAANGIKFTILAPGQAHFVKAPGSADWTHVDEHTLNTKIPYMVRLPSGAGITVFFYDGPVARGVAFEGLLRNGVKFAERLMGIFSGEGGSGAPELAHIATDGESYGHHSRFGEMALAYCLYFIEKNNQARITNYGEFLEKNPAVWEARIKENTSWSCFHGVERWRADCGCNTGGHPGWNQQWRAPLREALDWLAGQMAGTFEKKGGALFKDPWLARDRYIEVILNRSDENVSRFMSEHATKELSPEERITAIKLLEMQRHGMLMFTSCGWFFDDISGIESLQVLQYACRAIQLHEDLRGGKLEEPFLRILSKAKSNVKGAGDGAGLYRSQVKTKTVDLDKVSVHYAISSLYEDYAQIQGLYCYDVTRQDYKKFGEDQARLAVGRIGIRCRITGEGGTNRFAAVKTGSYDISCGLFPPDNEGQFDEFKKAISGRFLKGDFAGTLDMMQRYSGGVIYSLKDLFRDKQREILNITMKEGIEEARRVYGRMYGQGRFLMALLRDFNAPIPKIFLSTAEFALGDELMKAIEEEPANMERAMETYREMEDWGLQPGQVELERSLRKKLLASFDELEKKPDLDGVVGLRALLKFASLLPFSVNLWEVQNRYFEAGSIYRNMAGRRDEEAARWTAEFRELGKDLYFNTDEVLHEKH
ncbi:MAG: DUF3536 domain-containing protein [Nitrospiraceae bacterium]|nr:DUF3536 domain-containing protein [Nitrospiraceae bacterium]